MGATMTRIAIPRVVAFQYLVLLLDLRLPVEINAARNAVSASTTRIAIAKVAVPQLLCLHLHLGQCADMVAARSAVSASTLCIAIARAIASLGQRWVQPRPKDFYSRSPDVQDGERRFESTAV